MFLGGLGRSGSTLVSRALGQVPGICAVGELGFLWGQAVVGNRQCACGEAFHDCDFWRAVGKHAFGGWDQVDASRAWALRRSVERLRFVPALATGVAGSGFRSRLAEYTSLTSRVYTGIREASGCDVIVDSSKYPSSAYLVRRTPGIDVRLLHLIRTSQGVAYSWTKVVNRPDRGGKPMARVSPVRSAINWDIYNLMIDAMAVFGIERLRMRYEDFVAGPEHELRRVLSLAGLDADADFDFIRGDEIDLPTTHMVAGNPMRFRAGTERLVRDDQWQAEMPTATRRLVTALTLPGLLRYGYGSRELR